tara:strand:- start:2786 stop:3469 length:684 start_codon:yes stop_codon:yes gene_type:complete
MIFRKDNFLQRFIKKSCYVTNSKKSLYITDKLNKPFFLTFVWNKKLTLKEQIKFNSQFSSKLVVYKKKFTKQEHIKNICRNSVKSDKKNLERIISKTKSLSRFIQDKKINKKLIKNFRKEWILNYFKNKKNKKLIVCEINQKLAGFVLLKDFLKYLRIEIIIADPKYRSYEVGSSMISYINNIYLGKRSFLIAGTQSTNKRAIKFYKKNEFTKYETRFYYHIYSKHT